MLQCCEFRVCKNTPIVSAKMYFGALGFFSADNCMLDGYLSL